MKTPAPKILAIDDTPENLRTLGALLSGEFDLQIATSGSAGLALATQSPPDLILLDIMMPGMDGYETCQRLKADPRLKDIPVIFVTAMTEVESEVKGLALGAADYIIKPINVQIATQRIRNLLEREKLRKQIQAQHDRLQQEIRERERLENERRQALDRLEKIAHRVPGMVYQYLLRPDGSSCFPFASEAIRDVYGVSPQEVSHDASAVFSRLHPDDVERVTDSIQSSAKELSRWECEYRVKFGDGTVRWLAGNAQPEAQSDGSVLWHGFISDITQRKQTEAVFHGLFDQSIFLAGVLDSQLRLVEVNTTALSLSGSTREQLIGQYFPDTPWWTDENDKQQLVQALQCAQQGKPASFETSHALTGRDSIDVMFNAMPIFLEGGNRVAVMGVDISQRKHAERSLLRSEQRFRNLFERNTSVMLLIEPITGQIVDANLSAAAYYGYTRQTLKYMRISDINTMSPDRVALERQVALREERGYFLFTHRLASGDVRHVEVYSTPIESEGRALLFSIVHDINERYMTEQRLQLAASVYSHAREGIMITGADGLIIDVNDAFTRITGYSRDEVRQRSPSLLSSGRHGKEFYHHLWDQLNTKGHWYGEIWNRRKSGEVYAEMQTISAVKDAQGVTQQYVSLFFDITTIKEHERKLEHIAHYDALTGLPNRVLLADRLHQAMAQTQRRGQLLAVCFLDLDGFKTINDSYGHEAGDQLLIALAARMKLALREGDTLSRMGGDEFVAVILDLSDVADSVPTLRRLLAAAAQPVPYGELMLQVSASLGVTFFPQLHGMEADQLLRQADQAMYLAKLAGKNRYHVFDAVQDESIRDRHESMERIRQALVDQEFVLYYQPKVNMSTGAVIGAEALIRWQHPVNGLLLPGQFLSVVEDHPLAVALGEWVINTALSQIAQWRAQGLTLPVSVNVGGRQLQQVDFVARLKDMLAQHPQVAPFLLEIEVLETSALEDLARVSQVIEECKDMGVQFAIDDFGTGYSSLTYLKRLRVKLLKIDQSFVRDMLDDPDDLAILQGVIGLANAFQCEVTAEGVETVAHGNLLLQLGCQLAQGYGIARPMPAQELPAWALAWKPDPTWCQQTSVGLDKMPFLRACVEHRAWISALSSHLTGERQAPPDMDHQQCNFGKWLLGEGASQFGQHTEFAAMQALHQRLHANAMLAMRLQAEGHHSQVQDKLPELISQSEHLLAQLSALAQAR